MVTAAQEPASLRGLPSDDFYRTLFEQATDAMLATDSEGRLVAANTSLCALAGYTGQELLGSSVGALLSGGCSHDRLLALGTLHGGEIISQPCQLRGKGGRQIAVQASARVLDDGRSLVVTLHTGDGRFERLFAHMPSGLAIYEAVDDGQDFVFKDFNPAAEKIDGLCRQNVLGKRVTEVFPGIAKMGLLDVLRRVWRTGRSEFLPATAYRDARQADAWRENWVYKLPNGEVAAIYEDVGDRQRTAEALKWDLAVNRALSALYRPLVTPGTSFEQIALLALDEARQLTGSSHGFVVTVDPRTGENVGCAMQEKLVDGAPPSTETRHIMLSPAEDGLVRGPWGGCLDAHGPFFTNAAQSHPITQSLPNDHIPLDRLLFVPVMLGQELLGQIVLANATRDYGQRDLEAVQRIGEFFALAVQRIRSEEELKRDEARLLRLTKILQYKAGSQQDFLDYALDQAIKLTDSKIGYIYHYHEERREFVLNTWSQEVMHECSVAEPQRVYRLDQTGLWGEVVRQRAPILVNDYQAHHPLKRGLPEGHARLDRFLSIPVLSDGRIVAVVGLANKGSDYTQTDVLQLTLLMDAVWKALEHRRMEEEQHELERRLLRGQKLESLGVLAGGVAHDFNNLLMVMLGNMELGLMDLPPLSPARENIEEAVQAARRASDLTRQMLAYAGKGKFVAARVDLSEQVAESVHLLQAAVARSSTLDLRLRSHLPLIEADAGQIQQVVLNLVANASEALQGQPGVITITTDVCDCDAAYLALSRLEEKPPDGQYVRLQVSDNGCGMDKSVQQRMFEPFFTTKFTGRGLGLSAVQGIVRAHKGAIMVDSQIQVGTTVSVLFPVVASEQHETPDSVVRAMIPSETDRVSSSQQTVLVVDDEERVRRVCEAMVERLGFKALTARDGSEAVELFRQHSGEIMCVLMDLSMPRLDGLAALQAIKQIDTGARVLLSSGYSEQEAMQRFTGEGIAGFIQKPYELDKLRSALARTMP